MSAWKVVIKRMYAQGGSIRRCRFDDSTFDFGSVFAQLKSYGLVEEKNKVWSLTKKGVDFCEGRITFVRPGPKKHYFQATWLKALPPPTVHWR